MHTNRFYRGRRVSARFRGFAIAMGICLCAGQLLDTSAAVAAPGGSPAVSSVPPVAPGGSPAVSAVPPAAPAVPPVAPGVPPAVPGVSPELAPVGSAGTTAAAPAPAVSTTVAAAVGGWEPTPIASALAGTDRIAAAHPVAGGRRVRPTARERVLAEARRLRGRPYVFGAAGPRAFDCSGFTQYVFRKAGKHLPHDANAQQRRGRPVARRKARAGDLMVFRNGSYGYHAAIYAGAGYMYDAPRPGARVGKHKIWSRNYVVRRLV